MWPLGNPTILCGLQVIPLDPADCENHVPPHLCSSTPQALVKLEDIVTVADRGDLDVGGAYLLRTINTVAVCHQVLDLKCVQQHGTAYCARQIMHNRRPQPSIWLKLFWSGRADGHALSSCWSIHAMEGLLLTCHCTLHSAQVVFIVVL